ncbi:oligoribonuclease isoform X1 [Bradysia coprophila]|uniref:oligoribonuclease isoform X1 n=2 Tax=Bradysia coprophila TaxID=38358 RepID=UPI00187D9F0C|nr:oligoribonuclease isoform X1 [Bradysia coprophila]
MMTAQRLLLPLIPRSFKHYCTTAPGPPRKMSALVWMDLEMTGLDYKHDRIMEIACLITDNSMNIIAEGPHLIINQPQSLLDGMNEWCTTTHTQTGLLELCKTSKITEEAAEKELMSFLRQHVKEKASPLAGNSVYMDRLFLKEYMPKIDDYLHYRIIDVSTCKELCKRWNGSIFAKAPEKKLVHRGMDDIKESIEELKYYKRFMFTKN